MDHLYFILQLKGKTYDLNVFMWSGYNLQITILEILINCIVYIYMTLTIKKYIKIIPNTY